jgi:hypothetical protein
VLSSSCSDRSIVLYDLRNSSPIRKIVMQTVTNAMAWNPMEPLNFVVANEDCNLYSYDMRKLSGATCVHEVRVNRFRDHAFLTWISGQARAWLCSLPAQLWAACRTVLWRPWTSLASLQGVCHAAPPIIHIMPLLSSTRSPTPVRYLN